MTDMRRTTVLVLAVVAALPLRAEAAADYCVTCTGPDATYVCEVAGLAAPAAAGFQGQVLCIKSLAAQGGHASCTIDRRAVASCSGPLRTVAPDAAMAPTAKDDRAAAPQTPGANEQKALPAAGPAPIEKPKSGLEKVGANIGKAAGKTWTCLSSLFKDC